MFPTVLLLALPGLALLSLMTVLMFPTRPRDRKAAAEREALLKEATERALEALREELRQERARHPLRLLETPPTERYETPQEVQRALGDMLARINEGLTPEFRRLPAIDYHIRAPNARGDYYTLEAFSQIDRAGEVLERVAPWDPNENPPTAGELLVADTIAHLQQRFSEMRQVMDLPEMLQNIPHELLQEVSPKEPTDNPEAPQAQTAWDRLLNDE